MVKVQVDRMTTGKEPKKYLLVSIFEVPNFDTMLPVSQLLSLVVIPCNLMPISIPKAMTNAFNSGHVTYPAVMQRCNQQSLYRIVVALHGRSCLTWYIYILMLYVISYIYICMWRTHGRSTSADGLVTFVQVPFSATRLLWAWACFILKLKSQYALSCPGTFLVPAFSIGQWSPWLSFKVHKLPQVGELP